MFKTCLQGVFKKRFQDLLEGEKLLWGRRLQDEYLRGITIMQSLPTREVNETLPKKLQVFQTVLSLL